MARQRSRACAIAGSSAHVGGGGDPSDRASLLGRARAGQSDGLRLRSDASTYRWRNRFARPSSRASQPVRLIYVLDRSIYIAMPQPSSRDKFIEVGLRLHFPGLASHATGLQDISSRRAVCRRGRSTITSRVRKRSRSRSSTDTRRSSVRSVRVISETLESRRRPPSRLLR